MTKKQLEAVMTIEKSLIKICKDYMRIAGELDLYKAIYGEMNFKIPQPKSLIVIPKNKKDKKTAKIMEEIINYNWKKH
jgi:hypothetical protein